MSNVVNLKRDIEMFKNRLCGSTYTNLADKNNISTERVRQAYATMGQRLRNFAIDNNIALDEKCADKEIDYVLNKTFWLSVLEQYKQKFQ